MRAKRSRNVKYFFHKNSIEKNGTFHMQTMLNGGNKNARIMATSETWTRTLDPGPGPGPRPWTRTLDPGLKILDPEESGPWKTWETAGYGKMIRRPHIITY